jgi:ectoine hydroxylase-related dioxygenase (phytanoyl-CoA dioxygenase family)
MLDASNIKRGFDVFNKTGVTPPESYQSLINLFCSTKGRSSDFIHFLISRKYPKIKLPSYEGTLGIKSKSDLKNIVSNIKENGYHVFQNRISRKVAEHLYDFGINTPAVIKPLEWNDKPRKIEKIDLKNPITVRYDFIEQSLINDHFIQEILTDLSILSVAQQYLGCLPRADGTSMWWNTDFSKEPNAEAATMWHFDMDRVKWLKFFFYLTDVTTETGPHCFIKGSHLTNGIPEDLLRRGYARITDEEAERYYAREKFIEFIAERGTVIAEDTRGLHKGKPVLNGNRLLFQIQFSDHLFGGSLPDAKFTKDLSPKAEAFIKQHKDIYARYL